MFKIDLFTISTLLHDLPGEELVPTKNLNSYLMESVIQPILQGKKVHYGDLDYDQFDDLDLHRAHGYCSALSNAGYKLLTLSKAIHNADACASRQCVFC